jgi:NADH-quinone oxidoreductase subunit M
MGVPITSGFMAEWVLFDGSLQGALVNHIDSIKVIAFAIAMLTTALTSAYILWLYKRVFFGVVPETLKNVKDASAYVIITMGILAAFTLILGLYPDLFYKSIINYVENLYNHTDGIALIKQKTTSANAKVSDNLSENKSNMQKERFLQVGSHIERTIPILNSGKI